MQTLQIGVQHSEGSKQQRQAARRATSGEDPRFTALKAESQLLSLLFRGDSVWLAGWRAMHARPNPVIQGLPPSDRIEAICQIIERQSTLYGDGVGWSIRWLVAIDGCMAASMGRCCLIRCTSGFDCFAGPRPPQTKATTLSHTRLRATNQIRRKGCSGCCSCRSLFPGLSNTKRRRGCCRLSPVGPWRAAACWGRPAGTCARRRPPSTAVRACAWERVIDDGMVVDGGLWGWREVLIHA